MPLLWTDDPIPSAPEPLTDEQIIRVCMQTMHRYRKVDAVLPGFSARVTAARMTRLAARRVAALS